MEIRDPARKHGITDDEINHAWQHAMRVVEYEYGGQDRSALTNMAGSSSVSRCEWASPPGSSTPIG